MRSIRWDPREAYEEDVAFCWRCTQECFSTLVPNWDDTHEHEKFISKMKRSHHTSPSILILEAADGRPVGYLRSYILQRPLASLHLGLLAVVPAEQKQGYGSRALASVVDQAARSEGGARPLTLKALRGSPSLAWYLRFGFQELPDLAEADKVFLIFYPPLP
jgi:GNAT superfamily N-acetyltransferase